MTPWFKPAGIPDGGLLHDYDLQTQSISDGSTVSTLVDQQGSKDLSANGGPTGDIDGINGNPSVLYDGTDDNHQDGSSGFALGSSGEYTSAIVLEPATLNDDTIFVANDASDVWSFRDGSTNSAWRWVHENISTQEGGSIDTNPHVVVASYDGSTLVVEVDETEIINGTIALDTTNPSSVTIAARAGGTGFANFRLGRLLHYDVYYGPSRRRDISSGLADEWGITL